MVLRFLAAGAFVVLLWSCGSSAPPPEATAPARVTTSSSRSTADPTELSSAPKQQHQRGSVAGVVFDVAPGWTVVNEGSVSIAKSPEGEAGFVVSAFDDPGEAPTALHRADAEFDTSFPAGTASLSHQLSLGTLPYGFMLDQAERVKGDRLLRLSVLMGRGVRTKHLVVLAYVNVSRANARAEGERIGHVLETVFQTFAPAP